MLRGALSGFGHCSPAQRLRKRAAEKRDPAPTDKPGAANQEKPGDFRVLVFSKTLGFRHANIPLGVSAIRQMGVEHAFAVDATEDSAVFTAQNLARYKTVVFLSTTGDVLNADQEKALKEYITAGGGFAAIHGALFGPSACEETWAWYGDLCCVAFKKPFRGGAGQCGQ